MVPPIKRRHKEGDLGHIAGKRNAKEKNYLMLLSLLDDDYSRCCRFVVRNASQEREVPLFKD